MAIRRIADLPDPVAAAKADWLVASSWIGFTPASDASDAFARCQSTINSQINNGFVIEYITLRFGNPNPGYEANAEYLAEKEQHSLVAGRLVAVHRLRPSARSLRSILGDKDYERMQDMWAEGGARRRWSVAFPIVESYEIATKPLAREILSAATMQRLFAHPSATLRPLNDDERLEIADLPLVRRETSNAWVAIEDEIAAAEGSELPDVIVRQINQDLGSSALEGISNERWAKVRRRAAWLANKFVLARRKSGTLHCDKCSFDPAERLAGTSIKLRSALDVHHKHPLEEGTRRTTLADFALLCPTCHRIEHLLLKAGLG
jgi:5-methylcytosine-specific restriction protein A